MIRSLMLIGALLTGQVAATSGGDSIAEVRRLVRLLDAPQLAEREAAEAKLLRFGPDAIELLPPADDQMSAEVRQRLGRVRQRLQQAAADASTKASTITLAAADMPLAEILAAFQKQSGNKIVDLRRQFGQPAAEPKLTVNFGKTPFWPALDRVLDQAGLAPYPYAEGRAIGVVAAGEDRLTGRASYSGPFRIEPTVIVARRDLRRSDAASLVLSIEATWEPRLKIIGLSQNIADVTAVDDRGDPLPVADGKARPEAFADANATAVRLELPMQLPSRNVRQIASLKGVLRATIAGRHKTFRFDKLAEAGRQQKRIAHAQVTLEKVRKSGDAWEVRIEVQFDDAGEALASHRQWIFDNEAYLEGPDGKPIAYDTYETTAQGQHNLGLAYLFRTDRPLAELAFVYKTPVAIITGGFDYELKDIELP